MTNTDYGIMFGIENKQDQKQNSVSEITEKEVDFLTSYAEKGIY